MAACVAILLWLLIQAMICKGDQTNKTLCLEGWERCVDKCYKFLRHSELKTYEQATQFCDSLGNNVTLAILMTSSEKACFVNFLVKWEVDKALIVLNDVVEEDMFAWDSKNDLIVHEWDQPERGIIQASLFDQNTEDKDCVEVTSSGDWLLTTCTLEVGWTWTVCQQHIPLGKICGLNGATLIH